MVCRFWQRPRWTVTVGTPLPLNLWERPVCCASILDCPAEKSPKPLENQGFWAMVPAAGREYTMEHPAETPGGNSPPDCCIYMGSSPSPGYQKREPPRGLSFLVRATGLEPARLSQRNLNPPSLPIPPRPHVACSRVILSWEPGNVNGRQPEPLKFQAKADPCPNKFLKVSALSGKMTVCKDSHRQEMAKAHGTGRAF